MSCVSYANGWILIPETVPHACQAAIRMGQATFCSGGIALPATRENFLALESTWGYDTDWNYDHARKHYVAEVDPELLNSAKFDMVAAGLNLKDFDSYQLSYIARFRGQTGVLNGSEQGTGKTRMAWGLVASNMFTKPLIVTPKSVASEWKDEAQRIGVSMPVHLLNEGSLMERSEVLAGIKTGACVVNYEAVSDLEFAITMLQPDSIILDEGWKIKDSQSEVTKVVKKIRNMPCVKSAQILNGTPIGNSAMDLMSQIQVVVNDKATLAQFGCNSKSEFASRYVETRQVKIGEGQRSVTKYGHCRNPEILITNLAPYWFRATKASLFDMPPKRYHRYKFDMSPEMRLIYNKVEKGGESVLLGREDSLNGIQVTRLRMSQICAGHIPNLVSDEAVLSMASGDAQQLKSIDCAKTRWLRDYATDRLKPHPSYRVMIWCSFVNEVGRLATEIGRIIGSERVAAIYGDSMDSTQITLTKESFQSRDPGGIQVIVTQIDKMAYGHNLQSSDAMIYYSHTYSYIARSQSEDRTHRRGRILPVDIIELVYKDSIDEDVMEAVERKEDYASIVRMNTVI